MVVPGVVGVAVLLDIEGWLGETVEPVLDCPVGLAGAASSDVPLEQPEARTTNANTVAMWLDLVTVGTPLN